MTMPTNLIDVNNHISDLSDHIENGKYFYGGSVNFRRRCWQIHCDQRKTSLGNSKDNVTGTLVMILTCRILFGIREAYIVCRIEDNYAITDFVVY